MSSVKRHMKKWSVNEVLSLEREYELLQMTIQEIAIIHQRTINSILFKLQYEGIINDWKEARGWNETIYDNKKSSVSHCLNNITSLKYDDESLSEFSVNDDSSSDYCDSENYESEDNDYEDNDFRTQINNIEENIYDIKTMVSSIIKNLKSISYGNNEIKQIYNNMMS
jgi:hypothetical protein